MGDIAGVDPPYISAEVVVPLAAACDLAVFTSLISVHEEPFHCSTLVVEPFGGSINPDIHKAAVLVPVPEEKVLLV